VAVSVPHLANKLQGCEMLDRLSLVLFTFSVVVVVFVAGIWVGHSEFFPFRHVWQAKKTLNVMIDEDYDGEFLKFSDTPIDDVRSARLRSFSQASDNGENFLIFGGLNQYLDLCPEHGCLAVEMAPDGEVVHAYPYFPAEIFAANSTDDYPYEYIDFDPLQGMRPIGI